MILYRKGAPLRVRRMPSPSPPFFCATSISPYGAQRAVPLAVDYQLLRAAAAADRIEATVAENVRDQLERTRLPDPPVLVDAAQGAERVFRRGSEIVEFLEASDLAALHLTSTDGALPHIAQHTVVAIAAWPLDLGRLQTLFEEAAARQLTWGVFVPLIYPLTTELALLERLADAAAASGAQFLAATSIATDPAARHAVAKTLDLEPQDDRYAMLFHGSVEPLQISTERHLAALATERGLVDRVLLPSHDSRTNWNAAVLLTVAAARMLAMELDLDLAASIARSARIVSALEKPLSRIAESASLGIIGGLDETSVEMLTEWLERGAASFADFVDEQWRMRRA